jgi:hypothetical protein
MQILFNKTIDECRKVGARGGRARARNLRLRKLAPAGTGTRFLAPALETAADAMALLDSQFPWLIGAENARQHERGGIRGARAVL